MKCPKCGGNFTSRGLNYGKMIYNHHLIEMPGFGIRTRVCTKCGYKTKTAEVDVYQYLADAELITNLFDILETYSERRKEHL